MAKVNKDELKPVYIPASLHLAVKIKASKGGASIKSVMTQLAKDYLNGK
jgi:hypothetical protein